MAGKKPDKPRRPAPNLPTIQKMKQMTAKGYTAAAISLVLGVAIHQVENVRRKIEAN